MVSSMAFYMDDAMASSMGASMDDAMTSSMDASMNQPILSFMDSSVDTRHGRPHHVTAPNCVPFRMLWEMTSPVFLFMNNTITPPTNRLGSWLPPFS